MEVKMEVYCVISINGFDERGWEDDEENGENGENVVGLKKSHKRQELELATQES